MGLFAGTQWDVPTRCQRCGSLQSECGCPPADKASPAITPAEQTLGVRVEKRKAGRLVTVIAGLDASDPARHELLTHLKNACGAGGSHEGADLLIQGDHQARTSELLTQLGYRLKKGPLKKGSGA